MGLAYALGREENSLIHQQQVANTHICVYDIHSAVVVDVFAQLSSD